MQLNKIHCMDCLEGLKSLPDKSVDLVVTDPPYNIKKDSWDDIEGYEEWLKEVFLEVQRVLKDNGSFYWFHSEMEFIADMMKWLRDDTKFVFRQFIVWNKRFDAASNKGFLDGFVVVDALRNYQQMAEYCLYYTFQDETGLSKIMGHCVYPIRDYIRSEIERARGKIVLKEVNTILGTATNGGGVASACLSFDKTHPAMMTEEHYLKLRDWLNQGREYEYLGREYEYLRREYEYLRREYEDLRFTFNNQKTHHSVWNYEIAPKVGHVTPKPISMVKNILLHSSKQGQIVLDPFMGSGTTAVACQQTGRRFIGFEISKEYIEIAEKRLAQRSLTEMRDEDKSSEAKALRTPPTTEVVGIRAGDIL